MVKYISILLLIVLLSGCELIVLGSKKEKQIEINQNSAFGVVYLFKTELDSNNSRGATNILVQPDGKFYLAIDRYDMFDEMERMMRIIGSKTITNISADTLSNSNQSIKVEFDYLTNVSFNAQKIKNYWYITQYREKKIYY